MAFVRKNFLGLIAVISAAFAVFNAGDQSMQGIVRYYEDYARIISSGFAPLPGQSTLPTFPMWGFGWLIFFFRSKLLILVVQQLLALVAIATGVKTFEKHSKLPAWTGDLLRIALVLSIPWYALHSVYWPYSIAASLVVISLSLLVVACVERRTRMLVVSALCFGIALNFRSDFVLFPIGCAAAVIWIASNRKQEVRWALGWAALVYACLLPWTAYSLKATGHPLLTSTNSGQVFFIGLGLRPDNPWGITPDDGDKLLHRIVREKFGPGESEFSYDANSYLMGEAMHRVSAEPGEFIRKVEYAAALTVARGFHPGSFFDRQSCVPGCYEVYVAQRSALFHLQSPPYREKLNPVRTLLEVIASALSRLLMVACVLALPFAAISAIRRKSFVLLLSVLVALYQLTMSSVLNTLPGYSSSAFYFHLLNLVAAVAFIHAWRHERRSRVV